MACRAARACTGWCSEHFVHDALDGAHATPALRATAEAAIDANGGRRPIGRDRGADVAIAQHVAGADNHQSARLRSIGCVRINQYPVPVAQTPHPAVLNVSRARKISPRASWKKF